jgi:hypothetical protein
MKLDLIVIIIVVIPILNLPVLRARHCTTGDHMLPIVDVNAEVDQSDWN